jgi:hypothetical protein
MRACGTRQTGLRAGLAAAIGAALCLATAAGAAPGDTTFNGETTQGVKVKVVVASPGNATSFKLGSTESHCKNGTLTNQPIKFSPLDRSDPGTFSDRTSGNSHRGGYDFKSTTELGGNASADGSSWSGAVNLDTRVFQNGKKVDHCKLSASWNAK